MTYLIVYIGDYFSRMSNNESTEDIVLKNKMILFQVRIHSPCVRSPRSKMAETESVFALAAGNMCASMVQKAFSRCASDDFRRVLSRGLAVGGVAAKLVCGGGVGSGCSERVWRDVSHHFAGTAYKEARRQNLC